MGKGSTDARAKSLGRDVVQTGSPRIGPDLGTLFYVDGDRRRAIYNSAGQLVKSGSYYEIGSPAVYEKLGYTVKFFEAEADWIDIQAAFPPQLSQVQVVGGVPATGLPLKDEHGRTFIDPEHNNEAE